MLASIALWVCTVQSSGNASLHAEVDPFSSFKAIANQFAMQPAHNIKSM